MFWNDSLVTIRHVHSNQTQQVAVSLPGLPYILGYPRYTTLRFAIRKKHDTSSDDDDISSSYSDSEDTEIDIQALARSLKSVI